MLLRRATGTGLLLGALGLVALPACGSDDPPFSDAVMERLRAEGVAPGLVYTVEIPGHELAEQSVGVHGDDGFGAVYVSAEGTDVALTVERGTFDDELCRSAPIGGTEPQDATVICERDDAGSYRTAADRHQYVVVHDDHVLRLDSATGDLDPDALRAALVDARQVAPDGTADAPTTATPSEDTGVERGDLPTTGDGAPDNDVGPGG